MSAPKIASRWGVLAKLESSYLAATTLAAATDGVLVVERPEVERGYVHDGRRAGRPGASGAFRNVGKSGRSGSTSLAMEAAGPGTAYGASNLPNVHTLMRAAGYDAAVVTTSGAEKVTYSPSADGSWASAALELYARGVKNALSGVYADELTISGDAGGIPRWVFGCMGVMAALPTDASVPSITWAGAQAADPAKAEALTVLIGNFSPARVRSFEYRWRRNVAARAMDNTAGTHGGFTPGAEREAQLEVVVEAATLATGSPYNTASTLNPGELAERASALAVSLVVGSAQYKRFKIAAATAQLAEDPDEIEGNSAMWRLVFDLKPSAYGANDEVSVTFD